MNYNFRLILHRINQENRAHEQSIGFYFWWIDESWNGGGKNEECDDHQEQAVDETGQDLDAIIPEQNDYKMLITQLRDVHVEWEFQNKFVKIQNCQIIISTHKRIFEWPSSDSSQLRRDPWRERNSRKTCGIHPRSNPSCWSKLHTPTQQTWKPTTMRCNISSIDNIK